MAVDNLVLTNNPRLPGLAQRRRVRTALIKYRQAQGIGGQRLAKACQGLLDGDQLDQHHRIGKLELLARTIDYWCTENGDIKDPHVFQLLEHFVATEASQQMSLPATAHEVLELGRQIGAFLGSAPTTTPTGRESENIAARPTAYVLTQSLAETISLRSRIFLVLIDVGETSFYLAQFLVVDWREGSDRIDVRTSMSGFYFRIAEPPRMMLRDPITFANRIYAPELLDPPEQAIPGSEVSAFARWSMKPDEATDITGSSYYAWDCDGAEEHFSAVNRIAESRMWELGVHSNSTTAKSGISQEVARSLRRDNEPLDRPPELRDALIRLQKSGLLARPAASGLTHLHTAAWRGDRQAVERLLTAGGDPNSLDAMGRLPLDLALASGFDDVASLLEKATFRLT